MERYLLLNVVARTFEILTKEQVNEYFHKDPDRIRRGDYELYDYPLEYKLDINAIRIYGL